MRVIHDGCGSEQRPRRVRRWSAAPGDLGSSSKRAALRGREPGEVEHGEVAHLADSPAPRLRRRARAGSWRRPSRLPCSRRCRESRRSSCCRSCPCANTNVRTVSGSRPAWIDTAASAGLNEIMMSISPSFSSCRCAGPFSGNCAPWRHSWGCSASYQAHSGAVDRREVRVGRRLLQHRRVRRELVERLLQERGAEEVAHGRMREPARDAPAPSRSSSGTERGGPQRRAPS